MPDIKRMRYFDQQLLVVDDFKDEQEYHISMRQLHNRICHTPGVASGLEVKVGTGQVQVVVSKGTAIDINGREIVLDTDTQLSLTEFASTDKVIITIKYQIVEGNPIGSPPQNSRLLEKAELKKYKAGAGVSIPADEVILANITLGAGSISSIDYVDRKLSGAPAFDNQTAVITARSLRLANSVLSSSKWPSLTCTADNLISLQGTLSIDGSLGIGTTTPAFKLDVRGPANIAELIVSSVTRIGMPSTVQTNGQLHVLTSTGASAFFQSAQPRAFIGIAGSEGLNNRVEVVNSPGGTLSLLTIGSGGQANEVVNITKQANVGIGTATPQAKLEIKAGAENQTKPVEALRISGPNTPNNQNSAQDIRWSFASAGSAIIRSFRGGSWDTYIQFLTNQIDKNSDSPEVRMTISQDGKVAIGPGSPKYPFDVASSDMIKLGLERRGGGVLGIFCNENDDSLYLEGFNRDMTKSANRIAITGNWANIIPRIELNAKTTWIAGNLGIGVEPAHNLHIAGPFFVVNGNGNEQAYIGGDGAGNDVQLGSFNASMSVVSLYNPTSNKFMDLRCGNIYPSGAKNGYVTDMFINAIGEILEEGDIVVVGRNQSSMYYGNYDAIPIPEVDLTQQIYDTAVCGIVCQVEGEIVSETGSKLKHVKAGKKNKQKVRSFTSDEVEQLGHSQVHPGQVGLMVTLGAYACCKVDADIAPIEIGDLLTTSPTKGHAQKVLDPSKATGAIIGKALGSLKKGKGKISVLVTLH